MPLTPGPELLALTLIAAATALMWLPYMLSRIAVRGLWGALANPPASPPVESAWADRARRAHANAVENLVVFAPLAIVVVLTGTTSPTTALASQVYVAARLVHYLVYLLGVPVLRTLAFFAGWGSTLMLAGCILGWVR